MKGYCQVYYESLDEKSPSLLFRPWNSTIELGLQHPLLHLEVPVATSQTSSDNGFFGSDVANYKTQTEQEFSVQIAGFYIYFGLMPLSLEPFALTLKYFSRVLIRVVLGTAPITMSTR